MDSFTVDSLLQYGEYCLNAEARAQKCASAKRRKLPGLGLKPYAFMNAKALCSSSFIDAASSGFLLNTETMATGIVIR